MRRFSPRASGLPRFSSKAAAAALAGILAILAGGFALQAQNGDPPGFRFGRGGFADGSAAAGPGNASGKSAERQREGTRIIDELGTFQSAGDRVAFLPAGNRDSYRVLENLALERVDRALEGTAGQRQWIISGVLTEYRGANYLLITKAQLQLQEGDSAAGR